MNDFGPGLEVATSEGVGKQWLVSIYQWSVLLLRSLHTFSLLCAYEHTRVHACMDVHTHIHHTPAYDSEHNSVDDFADTPQLRLSYPLQPSLQVFPIKYLHAWKTFVELHEERKEGKREKRRERRDEREETREEREEKREKR